MKYSILTLISCLILPFLQNVPDPMYDEDSDGDKELVIDIPM